MGLFDFLKKGTNVIETSTNSSSKPKADLEHLTAEGGLPWGWTYNHKDFVDKRNEEFSYFLNLWLDSRKKSPKELYWALKSFVTYLEDLEKLCVSKGECYEFWFYHIIASKNYIEERESELNELTANLDELQQIYEKKLTLFPAVIELLKSNDGILQSEFKQLFDEPFQNDVSTILYNLHKEGRLERIKQGKTYVLHFRG